MILRCRGAALLLATAATLVSSLLSASPPARAVVANSATPVPAAPSNLTAKAADATSVKLTWKNNAANQSGVVISLDGAKSADVPGATVSSYTWKGLSPGTKYWFYIASKIYGTPGDPTGSGNTQSPWVGPAYATTAASSSTPCDFTLSLKTCKSTDPTVSYTSNATGDTSHCTFVFKIKWGDGVSTAKTETDPTDGHHLIGKHKYAASKSYAIAVNVRTTVGKCTATSSTHTFKLIAPPIPPSPAQLNDTWSGYGGSASVVQVGADWHVPSLSCVGQGFNPLAPNPAAAQWIGLGGTAGNKDLEQVGILSQCVAGFQFNTLVWEILPQYTTPKALFQYPIQAGDKISAVVKQNGGKQYEFSVQDSNSIFGWTWKDYENQQDSAAVPDSVEWVMEAQKGYTAQFSPVTFSDCYYVDAAKNHHNLDVSKLGKFVAAGPNGPYTSVSGSGDHFTVKFVRSS